MLGVLCFSVSSFNMVCLFRLKEAEKPFCERLHRVRDLMDRSKVSIEEVISELGQYLFTFVFLFSYSFSPVGCHFLTSLYCVWFMLSISLMFFKYSNIFPISESYFSFQVMVLQLSTQCPLPSSVSSTACSPGNAFQRATVVWRGQ